MKNNPNNCDGQTRAAAPSSGGPNRRGDWDFYSGVCLGGTIGYNLLP